MKKALLILGLVAFLGTGFTSCKKDCKCTLDGVTSTTKTKKKDCKDYTETISYMGYSESYTVKCEWGK